MNRLTIYTSFSFLLDSFDLALRQKYKDFHFHIVTFRDHPARLLEQITKEAKVGVPTADIIIGPHWMVLDLQVRGLLRKYGSSELDAYQKGFYDEKGTWAAMALSPVGFAYNTELVNDAVSPKTLEQVLDEKWRNKLAVHSIVQNIEGRMGLAYLVTLQRFIGQRKWNEFIERLSNLKPAAYECMPEMALRVGMGEKHVGFPATLACISYYLDVQNRPIVFRQPTDVPPLWTFSPSIGIVKGGENPKIAEMAFDFALSQEWQEMIGGFGGKIPARKGVAEEGRIPEGAQYFPSKADVEQHPKYLELLRGRLGE
ncbi:MAG: ABC transporter substrate-binding protein [Thaumarchaeota archaeon]|nr:ABC transporter substrate-binding protein [Nitrososphaerota archaeon]